MTQPFEAHLTTYLQHATSADKATRDQAEAGIRQLEEADWGTYIGCLATEIANESVPDISRQMAGVLFKNALDAKDSVVKVRLRVPALHQELLPRPI
jgi:importin subunit beta-1